MISIGEYLGFFLKLIFGFGMSFELPVFTFFLATLGLIDDQSLIGFFRYAILIIFVFAALLTPPDIMTQFLMAGPLILLYGFSIIIVRMVNPSPIHAERKAEKKAEESSTEEA
jgi:sec-independent protein translocase protein TatC